MKKLGIKRSLIFGFLLSLCGAIPMILIKNRPEVIPAFYLLARVGITFNQNVIYLAFSIIFPPIFSNSAFGFAKFIARVVTIMAPLAAELKSPTPLGIFAFWCIIAVNTACFIKSKPPKPK